MAFDLSHKYAAYWNSTNSLLTELKPVGIGNGLRHHAMGCQSCGKIAQCKFQKGIPSELWNTISNFDGLENGSGSRNPRLFFQLNRIFIFISMWQSIQINKAMNQNSSEYFHFGIGECSLFTTL